VIEDVAATSEFVFKLVEVALVRVALVEARLVKAAEMAVRIFVKKLVEVALVKVALVESRAEIVVVESSDKVEVEVMPLIVEDKMFVEVENEMELVVEDKIAESCICLIAPVD
jgi:hypothetical protein